MDGLRILLAPSGYKECLLADEVARALAAGARRALPEARVTELPLVDGGEGFARAMTAASGGRMEAVRVAGPLGDPVEGEMGWIEGPDGPVAVMEMASVAGLRRVPASRRDPLRATTRGVGEMLLHAMDRGAAQILLGCGDSGTCDGGAGMAQALGFRLLDESGAELPPGGGALERLARLDAAQRDPRLASLRIEVACNREVRLREAARRFGPQKGADPAAVERLGAGLHRWAEVLERDAGAGGLLDLPGGGASGGLGSALAVLLGARLLPWQEMAMSRLDLDGHIAAADLVVTAEGSLDERTPLGKIPAEVARRARRQGVPVIALAGTTREAAEQLHQEGIDAFLCTLACPSTLAEAMDRAAADIERCAEQALRAVAVGLRVGRGRRVHAA